MTTTAHTADELAAIATVIIAASDDLDAIHERETRLYGEGYRTGYLAGYAHGLIQGDREASDRWVGIGKLAEGPSHAELQRRRNEPHPGYGT